MRDEVVLDIQGEAGVATTEDCNNVILEGLDGNFGGVGAMQVRRN